MSSNYPATSYPEGVDLTIIAGNQLHQVINGDADKVISTDGGDIPSVRKALADIGAFKPPINWVGGAAEEDPFQVRLFTDGSYYWAPSATNTSTIPMGSTPIGDPNWKLAPLASNNTVSNTNLLSNHNFLKASPDASVTPPSEATTAYPAGTQVFSGWYAGVSGVSLKKENSLITIISGSLYQDIPRNNGLELVTHFIASVSDFQGTPTVSNVSHSIEGSNFRVTISDGAVDVGSVKFEQGKVPTQHGVVEVVTEKNIGDYTGIVYKASGGKSAFENVIEGIPLIPKVNDIITLENGSELKRVSESNGDITDFICVGEIVVNDFVSPSSSDNTQEFDLSISKANADNVHVSARGNFVVNPSEKGIQIKVPFDFSLCEFKPTSKTNAGRVFEIVQDDFTDITSMIDKSRMVKGAHRLYNINTNQPLNVEGFVMIETDTIALYRWNDNTWTPEYVKEPKTMSGYWGDLSTPLYFDYTSTSNLRVRVKKQMPNLEGNLGVWDISDSDFYTVCQISRNDVTTTGPTIKERDNTTSSNLYTPIQNLYCNNTIFKGIKAGALGSEAVSGYAVLLNSCDNPHIEGMENRGGWGGVDGNYFARLTIEDSTAFAYSTHAFGWDISISNSYSYRVGSIHGGGKFIMYNCKMLSQALRDSYMNDYFVQTRVDYGSSWNGDIKIINCSVEPKNALSKFVVVFVNGAKTDASKRGVELNQMPNVTVENFKFRTVNPDSGNIELNIFSTECTDTNKDWISYTKLPSKILISGIDADSEGGYIRMKSIRNQVDHTSGNYFVKNKDYINMSVSDASFSADPAFARRWSELSVYGVESFAIPKANGIKQKITIRNSDWHGVYIRTTENITVDAYDSILIGPYRGFNSQGNIYNLDDDSRVTFNNCRLIKLWDLGTYFSNRILPTYFNNSIFDWQSYFTGSEAGYDTMYHETWKAQTQAVFNCSYAKARLSGSQDVVSTDLVTRVQENYTNSTGLTAITTIKQDNP